MHMAMTAMTANFDYPEAKPWRGGLALALILAAHLALLWFGLRPAMREGKSVSHEHAVLVWAVPAPRLIPKTPHLPATPAPANIKPTAPAKATVVRMILPPLPNIPNIPNTPTAPIPAHGTHDTPQSPVVTNFSRDDLAKISQEIAKEAEKEAEKTVAPNHIVQKYSAEDTRLGKGIKAAYRGGGTTMVTTTLPDGRVLTKIVGPGGTYCASKDSVGATAGRDQIKDGVRDHMKLSLTGECPR